MPHYYVCVHKNNPKQDQFLSLSISSCSLNGLFYNCTKHYNNGVHEMFLFYLNFLST